MRAAVLRETNVIPQIEEIEVEEPQQNEVMVRIAASGICGSDIHVFHGTSNMKDCTPIILGHEGAGVVEQVGPGVTDLKRGDRVVLSMAAPCGRCDYCDEGQMQFCNGNPRGATFGEMDDGTYRLSRQGETIKSFVGIGSLGELAVVRRRKLVKFEQDMPFESACLISCGVTTGLGAALNTAQVTPGSSVLVFGCGGVGLSIIQGALIAGAAKIIAVDTNPAKLDLAANFGATHCLISPEDPQDLEAAVRRIAPRGVHYAFDAVGTRAERLRELMALTERGGTTVAVGVLPWTQDVAVPAGNLLFHSRKLTGTAGGNSVPSRDVPRIFDWYAGKRLKLDELVGATFALDEIGAAFEAATQAQHGRTVVRVSPSLL